jgi:hypothetical protein
VRADHPTVAELRGALYRSVRVGGKPNRRARFLQRFGIDADIRELEGFTAETDMVLGPQSFDNLDALSEALEALLLRDIECFELFLAVTQTERDEGLSAVENIETRWPPSQDGVSRAASRRYPLRSFSPPRTNEPGLELD